MRNGLWKVLLISFFIIMVISLVCKDINAQLTTWPAAIADPYAAIFAGFGLPPLIGGVFGVTSLFGALPLESFLYPSYSYYDLFDFDYLYWPTYPYELYAWDLPYFGVTSAYFPIYTGPPWWASALAFL